MQNKWSKVSKYCIERNNFYISRYTLADGANRFVLWDGHKMIKINDNAQELKDEAQRMDSQSAKPSATSDLFGRINQRRKDTSSYDQRKG
jgi:hypothetical protein